MIAKLKELRKNEEGFTLIELMIVVLIIGILAAIAIPVFLNTQAEAVKSGMKSDVRNTVSEVATHLVSNPTTGDLTSSKTGEGAATGVITPVVSDKDTTVYVAGAWDGYTVSASNPNVSDFGYAHYSSDAAPATASAPAAVAGQGGQYVEFTAAPEAPADPGAGSGTGEVISFATGPTFGAAYADVNATVDGLESILATIPGGMSGVGAMNSDTPGVLTVWDSSYTNSYEVPIPANITVEWWGDGQVNIIDYSNGDYYYSSGTGYTAFDTSGNPHEFSTRPQLG